MKTDIDVTVIMSVYNCGKYLPEAIESILNQTFRKLEIVICDDCSKDNTFKVAMDYARRNPGRILVLRNGRNRGQAYARNRCIAKARGRYIAIMDGDDSCSPLRIEKEMAFLRANPAYDYVGTWMRLFDDKGFWKSMSGPCRIALLPVCSGKKLCWQSANTTSISNIGE